MELQPYKAAEFDQRLALLRGKPDSQWWANYALALCAHQLFGDAAQVARETKDTEWDVEAFVAALQHDRVPEPVPTLENSAIVLEKCLSKRVERVWKTYKRISNQQVQEVFGGADLQGWYEPSGDDWVAVERQMPRENAVDLLVEAAKP